MKVKNEVLAGGDRLEGTKGRVLIIDDSAFITKQLTQILTGGGYTVVGTAPDGEAGVELYRKISGSVDLILSDINMPKMDGIATLEQIIAFNKDARVIMISTQGTMETVKKAILIGAKGFIVKPPVYQTVLERVAAVMK